MVFSKFFVNLMSRFFFFFFFLFLIFIIFARASAIATPKLICWCQVHFFKKRKKIPITRSSISAVAGRTFSASDEFEIWKFENLKIRNFKKKFGFMRYQVLACVSAASFHFPIGLVVAYSAILVDQLKESKEDPYHWPPIEIDEEKASWIGKKIL